MEQEFLDIVNEDDEVIDRLSIDEAYRTGKWIIRSSSLFIKNSEWKLWIPRRNLWKSKFPGALDFSAGGHVSSGETYIQWLVRESKEEINIILNPENIRPLWKLLQNDIGYNIRFFSALYEYITDTPPSINPKEHSESLWLTPEELYEKLLDPKEPKYKSGLKEMIERFYLTK